MEEMQGYQNQIKAIDEGGFGTALADSIQEDAQYDQHPADMGTEQFEREKELGLLSNARRRLREIDRAMERMCTGTYGLCESCGLPIDPQRLEVFPSAANCIACQQKQEVLPDRFHRPVEEKVLTPPFGRTWRDESGDPGYDGEDAWQEVGDYGPAESPQDVPGALQYGDLYHSDEDVYSIVDPMDALVDDEGDQINPGDRAWDTVVVDYASEEDDTLHAPSGPEETEGRYRWEPHPYYRGIKPERQFRAPFPRRRMP